MNYEELLIQLIKEDERIVVMTAENRAAIRNLPDIIKDRFIDVGIAEQTMIGMAAGLALRGRIPIVHSLAAFLTMRAFEFIRTDVGIGNLPVKLVGAVPGFLSDGNGPTHQAIEDISLMRSIPPVNIFCPSDEEDMLLGMREVILHPSPFYIRYNNLKPAVEHNTGFRIGKAEVISEGRDIVILTYGILLKEAVEAAGILQSEGRSVGVINLRTLKPIDEELLKSICLSEVLVVTLEDHFITGGLYSILSECLVKDKIRCNVLPVALENKWFKPALLPDVLEYEGFTAEKIAGRINNELIKLSKREEYSI
ncbi:MAG TPA: transketolase C-terminal domain-containing protein [Ignavibacteriaceae bacterium]|nr:transketolase C-terminal domain-containing protein [Ignavibacteriaceae bacterium]